MNVLQAKQLSLPNLLARLGFDPVKTTKGGKELWYKSPFRPEADASFHTSYLNGKWIWNDFGDTGGTVIDFVMRYKNFSQVKDALAYLEGIYQPSLFNSKPTKPTQRQPETAPLFSFQQQSSRAAAKNFSENGADRELELIDAQPITNTLVLSYLEKDRCIPRALAQQYLYDVRYKNTATGKEYFAFGIPNQSGGYEIRVASNKYSFKSALKARDITVIEGNGFGQKTVSVFEGMVDYLSFLVMMGATQLQGDAIIMHSLSSFGRTADYIKSQDYAQIHTYLDNNDAGMKGTERFLKEFGAKTIVRSEIFAPHVDLNDALRAHSPKSSRQWPGA